MGDLADCQLVEIGLGVALLWSVVWLFSILAYGSLLYRVEHEGEIEKKWFGIIEEPILYPSRQERSDALTWGACFLTAGLILGLLAPKYLTLRPVEQFFLSLAAIILMFQMGLPRLMMFQAGSLGIGIGYLLSALSLHAVILRDSPATFSNNYSHILILVYLTLAAGVLCRALFARATTQSYARAGPDYTLTDVVKKVISAVSLIATFISFYNNLHTLGLLK
jgi:hypothetical protein